MNNSSSTWQQWLTVPHPKKAQVIFWFSLSLTFSAIYGWMVWQKAFKAEYVIQDDARQHIFWMQRFTDPELFPGDLIADYFQSVAPLGYTTFYKTMAGLGIEPLLLSKILPPVLGMLTTIYCFGVTMEILPVPFAGFMASTILNQSIWMKFDVVSATPRAFIYPLFVVFIYYLLRRQLIGTCVAIALLGLFYPQLILICCPVLVLRLLNWKICFQPSQWSKLRKNLYREFIKPLPFPEYRLSIIALTVGFFILLIYALKNQTYGEVITARQAMNLPDFWPQGRHAFFNDRPIQFWFMGELSGLLPPLLPPLIWLGLLLPWFVNNPGRFPLGDRITRNVYLLLEILMASVGLFLAAHAVLFRLYLPSRYMEHSCRIVFAIATGLIITLILDAALQSLKHGMKPDKGFAIASGFLIALTIFYPLYEKGFPRTNYRPGRVAPLYEFFQKQPKDILIASLASEANNIPSFAKRSILVGREYAIPLHVGYYNEFSQRSGDLIHAQYTPNLQDMQQFIQKYGIDFWLLEASAFNPDYFTKNSWLNQYQPAATEAIAQLDLETTPAIASFMEPCAAFKTGDFVVLNTECMIIDN